MIKDRPLVSYDFRKNLDRHLDLYYFIEKSYIALSLALSYVAFSLVIYNYHNKAIINHKILPRHHMFLVIYLMSYGY